MKIFKDPYLQENAPMSTLLCSQLYPFQPDLGYYVVINGVKISEKHFPDEFQKITETHQKVLRNLQDMYYDNNNRE